MTDPVADGTGPGPSAGRSIYGYALMIFCLLSMFGYTAWAFLPESWLREHGLAYFSSKYYALALPVYICTLIFVFASIIYPAINLTLTAPITSMNTLVDSHTRTPPPNTDTHTIADQGDVCSTMNGVNCIPPIYDLSIEDVNEMLFANID